MLLPDDEFLIQRDRALPGLRLLFDTGMMFEALRGHLPHARLDGVRLGYVRYKPGTSCLASYQIDTSAGRVDAYAIAYRIGEHQKLRKDVSEAQPSAPGPGALVFPDLYVAVHFFPNDVRLGALRELATDDARRELLSKLLPAHPTLWGGTVTRLAYKPHRRFVSMLSVSDHPQAVMKFYTRGGYDAASRNARAIQSTGRLRVPRRMGRSSRKNIAVYRWIEGAPLGDVAQMTSAAVERVGAAVREIHAQLAPDLPLIDGPAEAARLGAVASALEAVLPRLGERARRAVQTLIDAYPQPNVITTIHGDLHAKQVLVTTKKVALLDLDEASRSSPVADLGNFVGHLWRNAIQTGAGDENVQSMTQALLCGCDVTGIPGAATELAWHTAASLMRLTPHPFRIREANWPSITEAMLARVEQLLREEFAASSARIARVTVDDPFCLAADEALGGYARLALEPATASVHLAPARVTAIRVARHKPGRRCVLEYTLDDGAAVVGKLRAKGADRSTCRLLGSLRACGVSVPEPLGVVEECGMWLQRRFPGTPATDLLRTSDGPALARRIAETLVTLHRAGVPARKRHTIDDEIRILRERLAPLADSHPHWRGRMSDICDACRRLARTLPEPRTCGIHRDFYADHVIVSADGRLCLIDLDLYSEGDPALDVGNFIAHVTEQALREPGDPFEMRAVQAAMEDRFIELTHSSLRRAVDVYRVLSLVRHIGISDRIPARRHLTPAILDLCEMELWPR